MTDNSQKELQARMREEWDRRVSHDYRYWMSDGVQDDETMFAVGKRDMEIILAGAGLRQPEQLVALELGCGVGRLLRPAAEVFRKVIGVDVSPQAIAQARRLVADKKNIDLVVNDGFSFAEVASSSIDFAFTFAAISSMPLQVICSYLIELSRVVKVGGIMRLQVYLGSRQDTCQEDTIAIRSFEKDRFIAAVQEAGFSPLAISELVLPFEVSDPAAGLTATMVTLKKVGAARISSKELEKILCPEGEGTAGFEWRGSKTEYLMAIARASQHLNSDQKEEAKRAIEFAVAHFSEADPEVQRVLEELSMRIVADEPESSVITAAENTAPGFAGYNGEYFEKNIRVIRDRFPRLYEQLTRISAYEGIEVRHGESGEPVIFYRGVALDQVDKPVRASQGWVERALKDDRLRKADYVTVVGFAAGYHLQGLLTAGINLKAVIEPNLGVLKVALGLHDLSEILIRLECLTASPEDLKNITKLTASDAIIELLIHPQTQTIARHAVDQVKLNYWSTRGLKELRPGIAVVGPLYGGTLPIAGYVESGFRSLKQRVYGYDLSSFYETYNRVSGFFKNKRRADFLQSEYVELISKLVLEGLEEKPVDILVCMAQAPLSPKALAAIRERGIITVMWFVEDCRRFTAWQQLAKYYDYMFLIQKEPFPTLVEAAGAGRAIYLPVGCDPAVHYPMSLEAEEQQRWGSDVSFVGAGYHNRQQMFASLAHRDFKIWGTQWPGAYPFDVLVQEQGRRLSPAEYVKIFNASKININLHSSVERDGVEPNGDFVNPRTFELASCGVFQLVDGRTLLPELFEYGKELVTFGDKNELEGKIDYYLAHPDERQEIASRGRERALKDHTYEHRLQDMLGYIYADRYGELSRNAAAGPWPKVMEAAKRFPELAERYQKLYDRGDEPTMEALVQDVQTGQGNLSDVEMKLLFLHHIRKLVSDVNNMKEGKGS